MRDTEAPVTAVPVCPPSMKVAGWMDRLSAFVERSPRFWVRLGDWETRLDDSDLGEIAVESPVYVTGLARSGSTILLELLARHSDFATHRYRDFPLLFTPRLWNWFIDRAARDMPPAEERAHADGIAVTRESPEAFEEVIWMAFFRGLHDAGHSAVLNEQSSNPAFAAFYRDHIRKLMRLRGGRRYLAKGNYNVTRLGYLARLFPGARFLIPVRDPVWHIASLMKQHKLFCGAETAEPAVLRHMQRSGHFEFGLDRRPIHTGNSDALDIVRNHWAAGRELEGWAAYWSMIYGYIADVLEQRPDIRAATLLLRYEDLCQYPRETMTRILKHCGLPAENLPELAAARLHEPDYYRPCFTAEDLERLRAATHATASRFGYGNGAQPQIA
jgi:Sulfotransferase family